MTENECKRNQIEQPGVDPGYLMLAVYLVGVIVLVVLGWCGTSGAGEMQQTVGLDKVRQGELLIPAGEPGQFQPVPLLSMDVDIKISGIIARVTVQQHFKNESNRWLEALYVFPLPDESAVDHMEMQIGERRIIGEVKEKQEARKTYEAAKKAGKKTSLL
jgi:Ca-activated chloride channel family protein